MPKASFLCLWLVGLSSFLAPSVFIVSLFFPSLFTMLCNITIFV